jgi:hypothetical protein
MTLSTSIGTTDRFSATHQSGMAYVPASKRFAVSVTAMSAGSATVSIRLGTDGRAISTTTMSNPPVPYGAPLTGRVSVPSAPDGGVVDIYSGATKLTSTTIAGGSAVWTGPVMAPGTYPVTANYLGSATDTASSATGTIRVNAEGTIVVDRFFSPTYGNAHLYSADPAEISHIRATDPNWVYEGQAFSAWQPAGGACPGATAVFRFYSARYQHHFYTASVSERDNIIATDPDFAYEGLAYCAAASPVTGSVPMYRFWSPKFGQHHYTANSAESDKLRTTDPDWLYEGVAYYVLP